MKYSLPNNFQTSYGKCKFLTHKPTKFHMGSDCGYVSKALS